MLGSRRLGRNYPPRDCQQCPLCIAYDCITYTSCSSQPLLALLPLLACAAKPFPAVWRSMGRRSSWRRCGSAEVGEAWRGGGRRVALGVTSRTSRRRQVVGLADIVVRASGAVAQA
jgi:hypothetical protein